VASARQNKPISSSRSPAQANDEKCNLRQYRYTGDPQNKIQNWMGGGELHHCGQSKPIARSIVANASSTRAPATVSRKNEYGKAGRECD
jgi:hypothetical protein